VQLRGYQVQDKEAVAETGDISMQQQILQDLIQKKQVKILAQGIHSCVSRPSSARSAAKEIKQSWA
jgi:hypothetical protein